MLSTARGHNCLVIGRSAPEHDHGSVIGGHGGIFEDKCSIALHCFLLCLLGVELLLLESGRPRRLLSHIARVLRYIMGRKGISAVPQA